MLERINILKNTSVRGKPVFPGDVLVVGEDIDRTDASILKGYGLAEPAKEPIKEPIARNEESREEKILEAACAVMEEGVSLTKQGKPEVAAMEELLEFDITAAERDEAYNNIEKGE